MTPKPEVVQPAYRAAGKLEGKVALITGGDSGIGRRRRGRLRQGGRRRRNRLLQRTRRRHGDQAPGRAPRAALPLIAGGHRRRSLLSQAVQRTVAGYSAGSTCSSTTPPSSTRRKSIEEIDRPSNSSRLPYQHFLMFFLAKAALPRLKARLAQSSTRASVTAYRGIAQAARLFRDQGSHRRLHALPVRVPRREKNPCQRRRSRPMWTPLIPSTFPKAKMIEFGSNVPLGRPGQPDEVAPCFVFLASTPIHPISPDKSSTPTAVKS